MDDTRAARASEPSRFDRMVNSMVARRDVGGVRHLHPVDTRAAEGNVVAIYGQILEEYLFNARCAQNGPRKAQNGLAFKQSILYIEKITKAG